MRPFGVSCFLAGFNGNSPKLFQTEPSGAYNEWKANAIGRNASNLREFLEKKWEEGMDDEKATRLSIETLLEVVESSGNIEICIMRAGNKVEMMDQEKLDGICAAITKEKEAAEEAKKNKNKKE